MLINNKKIDRISGPVSFALLKPKKFIFDELKKEGVHLPIFMLFGDVHFSGENQCNNCTCDGGSSAVGSSCCMPVYSNEFLRLIDSISTKEYPVDFGIEGFLDKYEKEELKKEYLLIEFQKNNIDIMHKLREEISACYIRDLRGTKLYEKYCPTKNIRWHYMDARQLSRTKYNLENLIHSIIEDLKVIFSDATNMSKEQVKKIINKIKDKVKDDKLFSYILYIKFTMIDSPEEAIDTYFKADYKFKNSLVLKQIKKLSSSFTDLKKIEKMFSDYLTYILNQHKDEYKDIDFINKQRRIFYLSIFKNDIDTILDILKDKNKVNALINGFVMDLEECSIFMDLYYIFRTFKIPYENKNPFLSILYAGNFHRRNITYFLTDIIKYYDIVSDTKIKEDFQDPEMRCTYMPNINLNELALEYGVNINNNSNYLIQPPMRLSKRKSKMTFKIKSKKTSKRKSKKTSKRKSKKTSKRKISRRRK